MRHKVRSPRYEPLSKAWVNLVCQWAGIDSPSKKQIREIGKLWAAGYSHKDAGLSMKESG